MESNGYKKLFLLGAILLIVAGIFVVALKGVNVSLQLQKHESVIVKIGKQIDINNIKQICKEVFENKKYIVRDVEMFSDSANIVIESITDEEKEELINKINEKYETTLTIEDLTINSNSNIRIRDIVKPFIQPTLLIVVLTGVSYLIIYRNKEIVLKFVKTLCYTVITEALLASIIAIFRIPLSQTIITIMFLVAIAEIMFFINRKNRLNIVQNEQEQES